MRTASTTLSRWTKSSNDGITSLEVDIYVGFRDGKPTCLIGHEDATATGQTLEQYFANLNQKLPGFTSLWMDCKDLNTANDTQIQIGTANAGNSQKFKLVKQ